MDAHNNSRPERCQTCRWWDWSLFTIAPSDEGACRRYPPHLDKKSDEHCQSRTALFVRTEPSDWCGEWKSRETGAAPVPPSAPVRTITAGFSTRVSNCLLNYDLHTLQELAAFDAMELLQMRNFGNASLEEVREALRRHGLSLRGEEGSRH